MVDEILKLKGCIDTRKPYQSTGDVAIYYLKLDMNKLKSVKYDADCVGEKLKINHRTGDSFFYITSGGGSQLKKQWILVETKGKQDDYFEQLENSLALFNDADCSVHGRFIGTNVPAAITLNPKYKKPFDRLQQKFLLKKGTLYIRNKNTTEKWIGINDSEFEK